MINFLSHVVPGTPITIRAVSTPTAGGTYLPPVGSIDRPVLRQVADLVVDAGGTRDGFNSVARMSGSPASRGATYTLVGWGAPARRPARRPPPAPTAPAPRRCSPAS